MALHRFSHRHAHAALAGALLAGALAGCSSSNPSAQADINPAAVSYPVEAVTGDSNVVQGVQVDGGFNKKPTITLPARPAPTKYGSTVLHQGNGPVVKAGQTITVNYLGKSWNPKPGKDAVFDSSWANNSPASFLIGVGGVIPGWDVGLVGQKVGSQILMVIPPDWAYNQPGDELSGQTLVFVVDILSAK